MGFRGTRTAAAVVALAVTALMVGCTPEDGGSGEAGATTEFAANNGTITIPAEPQRIVALSRAIPALLEVDAPLVAATDGYDVSAFADPAMVERYDSLTKLPTGAAATNSGGGANVSYEQIAALDPDLIISGFPAKTYKSALNDDRLQSIAPTVDVGPTTPTQWRTVGEKAATAAGRGEAFGKGKAEYEKLAAEVKARYADKIEGTTFAAFSIFNATQPNSFQREYDDSFTTNIANDLGMSFPGGTDEKFSDIVSLERISDLADADVIVYQVNADGSLKYPRMREVLDSAAFKDLPAVRAGRVLTIAHAGAETYTGAMATLRSIADGLGRLPS
ncbi:ABC transporter substrate-binding protein [Gordonia shandongensis]|uniref:ABC transporter substrate-binding protein n=1 Tax=Gordonia shandongensis TaxID=376351 RepID=UPI00047B7D37|nr:ABC transporter substrate-binding protein [Gordonia shandongensis]